MRRWAWLGVALFGCTNAGIYSAGLGGPNGPPVAMQGTTCVPLASGDIFPVKVIFAVEDASTLQPAVWGAMQLGIEEFINSQRFDSNTFAVEIVAFDTFGTALLGTFTSVNNMSPAIQNVMMNVLPSFRETGPVSLRAPLDLAGDLLAADMQTACKGTVGRTHYVVILLYSDADATCSNPTIAAGLNQLGGGLADPCLNYLDGGAPNAMGLCGYCEVLNSAAALKQIGAKYGANEVTIQPIYIQTAFVDAGSDPAYDEGLAIANAGGSMLLAPGAVAQDVELAIASVDTANLQNAFVLKHVIGFNRNVLSRNGQMLIDSDGDGLSDDEERVLGTDPTAYASDGDCVGDGVKQKFGLPHGQMYQPSSCLLCVDTDGDGLSDCEEEIMKTNRCTGDTDGDYLPDLVEFLSGTNPLVPEGLTDSDRDGALNVTEVLTHTDPNAPDPGYATQFGYRYTQSDAAPTADGRACYNLLVENINLVPTLSTDAGIPNGTNDVYLYLQFGLPNDSSGTGFGSLYFQPVVLNGKTRLPAGTLSLDAGLFVPSL